ncbi:MAG: Nif11-like leader peptide family natural product precursor [Rhodocyclaceae bacterium]|nr:Nif11-like leader peptide family natural product precursor [Rhodocyclaceae bacterium]
MSEMQALQFLAAVRSDPQIRAALTAGRQIGSMEELLQFAASLGLDFSANDLALAFRHDWTMRWMRHRAGPPARGHG